jgi:hypothetical protein
MKEIHTHPDYGSKFNATCIFCSISMPTYFRQKVHQILQKTHKRLKRIKKKHIISFIKKISYSNILQFNY